MARKRRVDIRARRTAYKGWCRIDAVEVDFDRAAGKGRVTGAKREIFERGDSAAALIHDVERDVIVLTEQFRVATHDKGPGYIVELAAGSVAPGEDPAACMTRELMEETGYRVRRLTPVAAGYASPGACSERIFIFYARVRPKDLVDPAASGLAAEQEDIRRVEMPRTEFLKRLAAGGFEDLKLTAAGWWLRARPGRGKPVRRKAAKRR